MTSPFADPDVLFGLELKEPWASMVLEGSKTIETRTYDLPPELIGRPLVLLATPEDSGAPGTSGLADVVTIRGAATILGLVTFDDVIQWDSRETWAKDCDRHGVPDVDDGPYANYVWREDDAAEPGKSTMRGWTVSEVIPLPNPVESPHAASASVDIRPRYHGGRTAGWGVRRRRRGRRREDGTTRGER